jgi:hypothetical protein
MTTSYHFDHVWYHGFIRRVIDDMPEEASPDAIAQAIAILNGFAMIADTLHTTEKSGSNSQGNLADKMTEMADALSSLSYRVGDLKQ